MNIGEIIGDSIKYPLSNWKNFLILGIILVISSLYVNAMQLGTDIIIISILGIIGFILSLLVNGYALRIIKSSLAGVTELPEFNAWIDMFIDGIKVLIVDIVYLIPVLIIGIFTVLFFGSALINIILINMASNPSPPDLGTILNIGILIFIAIIYTVIILPIIAIATANMAYYDSKLSEAFRLKEIFNKIGNIGWINFIIWYIVTGIIYLALLIIGVIIAGLFDTISYIIGGLIISLIIGPYTSIYLFRSVALVYKS
jgi:hypothetical protein